MSRGAASVSLDKKSKRSFNFHRLSSYFCLSHFPLSLSGLFRCSIFLLSYIFWRKRARETRTLRKSVNESREGLCGITKCCKLNCERERYHRRLFITQTSQMKIEDQAMVKRLPTKQRPLVGESPPFCPQVSRSFSWLNFSVSLFRLPILSSLPHSYLLTLIGKKFQWSLKVCDGL